VASFLQTLGAGPVCVVEGGYRSYRRLVVDRLQRWSAPPCFVLRGLTGVGKTRVLGEIERQRPGWTLDLEGLAGHRSSILGGVGLSPCSQKTFESRLVRRIGAGMPGVLVLEGESRKVGDIVLPRSVWEGLERGASIELYAPREYRVELLIGEYLSRAENRRELSEKLPFIEERLGRNKWRGKLNALLDEGREAELVEVLLELYYDPLYRHSERERVLSARFDASDPERAAREVVGWIEARMPR
jgi:tRNA 2-selenouridine synthase